ncbi:hypothetical protein HDV05_005897 [Chytridiales sp. JEL 0842]|nr:hypothetical protein HDV05_005897 [Chytridiales sp. JEL 0842]
MRFTQVTSLALFAAGSAQATLITDLIQSALNSGNTTAATTVTIIARSPVPSATGVPNSSAGCESCAVSVSTASEKCSQAAFTAGALAVSGTLAGFAPVYACLCGDLLSSLSCTSTSTGNCTVDVGPYSPPTDLQKLKMETEAFCKPGSNGLSCVDATKAVADKFQPCFSNSQSGADVEKCVCPLIGGIIAFLKESCSNIPGADINGGLTQFEKLKAECVKNGLTLETTDSPPSGQKSSSMTAASVSGALSALTIAAAFLL